MWPRILSRLLKKSLIESFTFCAARDQLSQFENERLSKLFFALEVSNIFLRYMKEYFQLYKRSFSFFRSKKTQIFSLLIMTGWERSKIRVFEQKTLNYIFCIGNFRQVPAIKKYFWLHMLRFSFVKRQNTQTFLFMVKSVWERSKITVQKLKILKNIYFAVKILGRCLPTIKKSIFNCIN